MTLGCGKPLVGKVTLRYTRQNNENRPSDDEFQLYLERVLNPDSAPPPMRVIKDVTILVLDDLTSPAEVQCQIKKMKVNKACGLDGLTPSILSMLPVNWLITITTLFNTVWCVPCGLGESQDVYCF